MSIRSQDTNRMVTLEYDRQHPKAGTVTPLPANVASLARSMHGSKMTLRQAVSKIQAVTQGTVKIVWKHSYIGLRINENFWRVIRYR